MRLNYGQLTERNWQTDIQYDKDNVVDQTDGERNNSIPYLLRTVQFFLSWKQFAEKINTRILPNLYCVTSTNNNRPCVCYLLIDREWNIHTYIHNLSILSVSANDYNYLGFPNFKSTLEYWKYVYTKTEPKEWILTILHGKTDEQNYQKHINMHPCYLPKRMLKHKIN